MAQVGQLQFDKWLAEHKARHGTGEEGGEHSYAYVLDRQTRVAFERARPVRLAVEAVVRIFKTFGKNELLGQAVKIGPRQFPAVHEHVLTCAESLGIAPPTAYIVNNPVVNAGTFGTNDDSFVLLHSGLIDHMSDEELRSVIGHECGHIHNSHVVYLTALYFLTHMAGAFVAWIVTPAIVALRAWSRRAEITSDRAAMLCVRKPEIPARAITKLALGSQKLYEQLDMEAFVEQYAEGREGIGRLSELLASHPWLPKRVLALRVFEQSRLFRHRAGLGDDGLTMKEVDDRVQEIVKVVE